MGRHAFRRNHFHKGRSLARKRRQLRQLRDTYDPLNEKPTPLDLLVEYVGRWDSDPDHIIRQESKNRWMKGNYVDFLVGGANAAGRGFNGLSYLPFGAAMTGKFKLYRHNQCGKLRKDLSEYIKNMKDGDPMPRVIGHSWGGATVANLAHEFQDKNVPFIALDPVSHFNRLGQYPTNLKVLQPNGSSDEFFMNRLARVVGGAWPVLPDDKGTTIRYNGGHVAGLPEAVNELLQKELLEKMKNDMNALKSHGRLQLSIS